MMTLKTIPKLSALKTQAKRLRAELQKSGTPLSHSQSLELLAHQMGIKDWNTLKGQRRSKGDARR